MLEKKTIHDKTVSAPKVAFGDIEQYSNPLIATLKPQSNGPSFSNTWSGCFAAAGPRLWNTLPLNLRLCDSLGQFKRSLKTFLFGL